MNEDNKINFFKINDLQKFINVNTPLYKKKVEIFNNIIQEIELSKKNLKDGIIYDKNYKQYYTKLIELLEKIKPSEVYGLSAKLIIEDIKTLENIFNSFNEELVPNIIITIKDLLKKCHELIKYFNEDTNNRIRDFNLNMQKLQDFFKKYEKFQLENTNIEKNISKIFNMTKITKEQITEFSVIQENYNKSNMVFNNLMNDILSTTNLANEIYKKWVFNNLNSGISVYKEESKILNDVKILLEKIQFSNKYKNEYTLLLNEYKTIESEFYIIDKKYLKENLNKVVRTNENKNLLLNIINIDINKIKIAYEKNNTKLKKIEEKIKEQSKGLLSFLKKGKGNEKSNIFYILLIGLLFILIYIVDQYNSYISKYITILSGVIGSIIIFYGIYRYIILNKNKTNNSIIILNSPE